MVRNLAVLADEPERNTKAVIAKLEELSGWHSEDVRLLAKHRQEVLKKIESLGLDSNDTTGEELYRVLQLKFEDDMEDLARAVNYSSGNLEQRASKLVELACAVSPKTQVFALKKTVAKAFLRVNQPKNLMNKLRYRSLESMLKREEVSELIAVALSTENSLWKKKFIKQLSGVNTSDFENREISYHVMSAAKWSEVLSSSQPVSYLPLFGAVIVWPTEDLARTQSVGLAFLILQAAEIIETDSLYLKSFQFQAQFGNLASQLFETGQQQVLDVSGKNFFDWQNLKHIFEPEINALRSFTGLHPALRWWSGSTHTAVLDGQKVSMHLGDVVSNHLHGSSYEERRTHNSLSFFKDQLLQSYLPYKPVKNLFMNQLDDTSLVFEPAEGGDSIPSELEAGLI
jgi:hypothetical protein